MLSGIGSRRSIQAEPVLETARPSANGFDLTLFLMARPKTRLARGARAGGGEPRRFWMSAGLAHRTNLADRGRVSLTAGRAGSITPEPLSPAQSDSRVLSRVPSGKEILKRLGIGERSASTYSTPSAGQLRSALLVACVFHPRGPATASHQREARNPWRLRFAGTMATLRANLSFTFGCVPAFAVRLSVCVGHSAIC